MEVAYMADVFDVADFFIELFGQEIESDITNLKLNKLLYFAQGHCLAVTGKPLFNDFFEAWEWGPVVPAVYHKYKMCGKNPVEPSGRNVRNLLTPEEFDVLLDVAGEFGKYTALHLVQKTHKPRTPWAQTEKQKVINNDVIAAYFTGEGKIETFSEMLKRKNFQPIGYMDDEGVLVLPADEYCVEDDYWDDY
jgi:uncharacterized phage-associated protein